MCNLATSLFEHKRLVTTVAKAKELRPFAEQLITRARNAYNSEKAGPTPAVLDVHSRRLVGRFIHNKAVLQELFDTIAPVVAERAGGYTRIVKIGNRRGDASPEAVIELVDWSAPQDGRVSAKTRVKAAPKAKKALIAKPVAAAAEPVAAAAEPVAEDVTPSEPTSDAPAEDTAADDAATTD